MNWTPGPWRWEHVIEDADPPLYYDLRGPDVYCSYSDSDVEATGADARLIAAAPEMAEWIRTAVEEARPAVEALVALTGSRPPEVTQYDRGVELLARIRGDA